MSRMPQQTAKKHPAMKAYSAMPMGLRMGDHLTEYDRAHLPTYLFLLD